MQIFINDTPAECPENTSISALLSQQGIASVNIAVALNDMVIPKNRWETTCVEAGTHVLIIRAVQGG